MDLVKQLRVYITNNQLNQSEIKTINKTISIISKNENLIDLSNDDRKIQYLVKHKMSYEEAVTEPTIIPTCWLHTPFGYEKVMRDVKRLKRSKYSPDDFNIPEELEKWVKENFYSDRDKHKALLLFGGGAIVRSWAKSFGRCIHWRSYCDLSDWDDEAQYIVFDYLYWHKQKKSISIETLKNLIGCKKEFEVFSNFEK